MKNCPKCNSRFDPFSKYGEKKFCSRSCANSRTFTEESKNKTRTTMSGNGAGRKLSPETKAKISVSGKKRNFDYLKDRPVTQETKNKISKALTGRRHTDEFKQLMSVHAKKNGLGGHTSKKRLLFKKKNGDEIHLQSGYEIRFAEILEELNIDWERPSPLIWIDDENVSHRYYPDFKIGTIYIDTKNSYLAVKDARKIDLVCQQNSADIRIVLEQDITKKFIGSLV